MASVTGITAEAAEAILGQSVVSALINESGHLILTRANGTSFDAGLVTPDLPIVGTKTEYDDALSDANFATLALVETLLNKTLQSPIITGIGQVQTARKVVDEPITNNTLQSDSDLFFAVNANTTYMLRGRLFVTGISAANIKMGWQMPAGAVVSGGFGTAAANELNEAGSDVTINQGLSVGVIEQISMEFIFSVGANAGNVNFRWAQDTTNPTATVVKAKSCFDVRQWA